jgi:hypothetical protein
VLQIGKEWEDSAILQTSNRPQQKDKTKNKLMEMRKQNFEGKESREQTKKK